MNVLILIGILGFIVFKSNISFYVISLLSVLFIGLQYIYKPKELRFTVDLKNTAAYLFFLFLIALIGRFLGPQIDQIYYSNFNLEFISLTFIGVLFLSAFVEEVVYRQLLQKSLRKYFSVRNAVIFSSLIFTLSHINWSLDISLIRLISIFLGGIILGFAFEKEGLGASFLVHILSNLLVITQIILHVEFPQFEWIVWCIWGSSILFLKYNHFWKF